MKRQSSTTRTATTRNARSVLHDLANLSLQTKLILAFLVVTAISVSAVAFFHNRATSAELTSHVGNTLHQEAVTHARAVGDRLAQQIDTLRAFGLNKFLRDRVMEVNSAYAGDPAVIQAKIQALDTRWRAADDPLIQEYVDNQAADELRAYRSTFPDNVELFVTDQYGANVVVSNRTSDFYQADEAWWQTAWNNGQGAVYIGQPEFDDSSGSFSIVIALPLYTQGSNMPIGVLRTTYRLDNLIDMVDSVRLGETGRAQLFLPGGRFIAQNKTVATLEPATAAQLERSSGDYAEWTYQGVDQFVSRVPIVSADRDSEIAALGWQLVVHQERAESLRPANVAIQTTLVVAIGALLLAAVLGIGMAHLISAPLGRLTQLAHQIAQGDLTRRLQLAQSDEIGQLAQSFDTMAEMLATRISEQQQIYEALAAQYSEQQRLLEVISQLETPIIPLNQGILLVPLVGSLDVRRVELVRARILQSTSERHARSVIIDLTGVTLTESAVVHQLLMIVQGVGLLGAEGLFTGIRGEMAQLLVQLGVDLSQFRSVATLEAGIEAILNLAPGSRVDELRR